MPDMVSQTTYRPQIAPGLPGMIADMTESTVSTRIVETAAGIPFGVAVSQGAGPRGAIVGGPAFLGLAVRDPTQSGFPVGLSDSTIIATDRFPRRANMSVMSRGHMWVIAGADVVANDPLFYEQAGGSLSNSASGTAGFGSVTFSDNPEDGDTISVTGPGPLTVVTTFKDVVTDAAVQVQIGPNLAVTLDHLATFLNASADATLVLLDYDVYPPSPGGAGEGSGANQLIYAAHGVGTAGNALVVATNVAGATVQAMAGGTAAATAIAGGYWLTNALAGQLAKVSLGIQRG